MTQDETILGKFNPSAQDNIYLRPKSPALDAILGKKFPLLDHGYIRVVDYLGNEQSIVNSARVSYGEGTKSISDDVALLRYLVRHFHVTPLESAEIQIEMKLPIFVARQFVRHRTASISEYSARYSEMTNDMYVPQATQLGRQSKNNKQGRDTEDFDAITSAIIQEIIKENNKVSFESYETLLGKDTALKLDLRNVNPDFPLDLEIARELARMVLPVNTYTKWFYKLDGNNLLKMLTLRQDAHAQYEIRVYADAIADILKIWMPNLYAAYISYMKEAVHLSKEQFALIKEYVETSFILDQDVQSSFSKPEGMSKREFNDLLELFK